MWYGAFFVDDIDGNNSHLIEEKKKMQIHELNTYLT